MVEWRGGGGGGGEWGGGVKKGDQTLPVDTL